MRKILNWVAVHNQSLSVFLASLSLIGAAISFIVSLQIGKDDGDYRRKRETLAFFMGYSPATKARAEAARDNRLKTYFDRKMAITVELINDIQDDGDGTNDGILRGGLVDLVNYNEMLCMGRQEGVLDAKLFDLQFKEILKIDYRILKNFLEYTVQNKGATYPYWKAALEEYGIKDTGFLVRD